MLAPARDCPPLPCHACLCLGPWVATSSPHPPYTHITLPLRQVFETIIRVVGGMLSAHELTGDRELLER